MPDTALLDRPPQSTEDEDTVHLTCCDDDLALCGLDVSGDKWADDEKLPLCRLCEVAWDAGLPCQVTGCERGRMGP